CLRLTAGYVSNKLFLILYLKLVSSDKIEVSAKYKFSVVNDKGEEKFITELKKDNYPQVFRKESSVRNDWFELKEIFIQKNGLLCDDKLKIFCQISVIEIVKGDVIESIIQVPECRLIDDYEILFETKKFYDVILSVADGKEFQVHKTILAARSPVFAAMFEHEMEERKLNRVNITDIDYEILHELLKFIYTGKVDNLQTMAGELFAAADKYAQERLKKLCEKELAANLSTENVMEILVLADLHGANQLKAQAIDFIKNNPNVMTTMEWKKVKETHSHLIIDVCEQILCSKMSLIGLPTR
ncbi:speckle-type POZ protein-like, partial [Chrysoperla carnea]|uniref:speckle-type POZ protein-like n=1 Tax=Chrysoperla carnea TaxID=189513 RepID=UPI001D098174